jgi:hypothetical protein
VKTLVDQFFRFSAMKIGFAQCPNIHVVAKHSLLNYILKPHSHLAILLATEMTSDRQHSDKKEHNFVADAFNWEQRVKGETNAAKEWSSNWGDVFAPDSAKSYSEKIAKLKEKLATLPPVQAMLSTTHLSFTKAEPYKDSGEDYKRKSTTFGDEL